jgi:hypothetical protein
MAESSEPKKETVRIALPTQKPGASTSSETRRINLPARPPSNVPPPAAPPSAPSPPFPNVPRDDDQPVAPPSEYGLATEGPKKETARVASPEELASKPSPAIQMKKTQPLFTMPDTAERPVVPLTVTSDTPMAAEGIPLPLCWTVLAVSALILIIQIWNYFS